MKIKTADLIGPALDWAVGTALELPVEICQVFQYGRPNGEHYISIGETDKDGAEVTFEPSEEWSQGGPIIEWEMINVKSNLARMREHPEYNWLSDCPEKRICVSFNGPTPLIAAMRCYCYAKLGEFIDIPEELCPQPNN